MTTLKRCRQSIQRLHINGILKSLFKIDSRRPEKNNHSSILQNDNYCHVWSRSRPIGLYACWLVGSLFCLHSCIRSFGISLIYLFVRSFVYSELVHTPIHSSFTRSFIPSHHSFTHSSVLLVYNSFIHSFAHSFVRSSFTHLSIKVNFRPFSL